MNHCYLDNVFMFQYCVLELKKIGLPDNPNISVNHNHLLKLAKNGQREYFPENSDKSRQFQGGVWACKNVFILLNCKLTNQIINSNFVFIYNSIQKNHNFFLLFLLTFVIINNSNNNVLIIL